MKVGTVKKGGNWQIVNKCSGFLFKLEELVYGKNKKIWNEMVEEASTKIISIENITKEEVVLNDTIKRTGI